MAGSRQVQSARNKATFLARQVGKHILMRQRRPLVVLAGDAPGGGEIHEYRLARREQLIHTAGLPRCQGRHACRSRRRDR